MTHASVEVQITSEAVPSIPCWFAEVTILAQLFTTSGVLQRLQDRVRFARARMGSYDVIDFVGVLLGYAVSGEPTLEAFYERVSPFASAFMALFDRHALPHRSTLSRFLAALDKPTVEALRGLFLDDLVQRTGQSVLPGGWWDRQGRHWYVIDVDGTRQAARQRALPQRESLPEPHRRLDAVCAKGYLGRKRGEVGRTRTTVLNAHSHHWLGTFSGSGNGDYRGELARAGEAILSYAGWLALPLAQMLVRLDGLYGTVAVITDLLQMGLGVLVRCKDYGLLTLPAVQARLSRPPDQQTTHPESGMSRALFDCPDLLLTPAGPCLRLIVATHPATSADKPTIGVLRAQTVYELFLTSIAAQACTPADVLDLYLHRGSFETVLADEDQEQDPDRWWSHTPCGQEFCQILQQWLWNLRSQLGQHLSPAPLALTQFAPAQEGAWVAASASGQDGAFAGSAASAQDEASVEVSCEPIRYGPLQWPHHPFTKGFAGADFVLQPDGTLRCPADHPLKVRQRRPQRNGSVRIVYTARVAHCRSCPLREQCRPSPIPATPREVSAIVWPLVFPSAMVVAPSVPSLHLSCEHRQASPPEPPASEPVLWSDWPRSLLRRRWIQVLRTQMVTLTVHAPPLNENTAASPDEVSTRAQRAHWRLSWQERLARNARLPTDAALEITISGLPASLAQSLQSGPIRGTLMQ